MLTTAQKIYLVKNVDCHALSSERVKALAGYCEKYNVTNDEIKEISDMCYIQESTIRQVILETSIAMLDAARRGI